MNLFYNILCSIIKSVCVYIYIYITENFSIAHTVRIQLYNCLINLANISVSNLAKCCLTRLRRNLRII
jgi:hypothetical protein